MVFLPSLQQERTFMTSLHSWLMKPSQKELLLEKSYNSSRKIFALVKANFFLNSCLTMKKKTKMKIVEFLP